MKAVLFKSAERFDAFRKEFERNGVAVDTLDFDSQDWLAYDYSGADICLYFPEFTYSNNHPLALHKVYDNLTYLKREFGHLRMFPDPDMLYYYNDKYRQFLFLRRHGYPAPRTIPLYTREDVDRVGRELGYPMIVKNRFGAGGEAVMKIGSAKELRALYRISTLDLFNGSALRYVLRMLSRRVFYYHLVKDRRMLYPFLSPPLLAQQFVQTDSDLRIVTRHGTVVEAHWRRTPGGDQWKVNIDAGGIGEWSRIPEAALQTSSDISKRLGATWLALDLLKSGDRYLVTEFSPVWHHYAYNEKPTFVYKDDYNIDVPLEEALNLEALVVASLLQDSRKPREQEA